MMQDDDPKVPETDAGARRGLTVAELGERLGLSPALTAERLLRHGIGARGPGERIAAPLVRTIVAFHDRDRATAARLDELQPGGPPPGRLPIEAVLERHGRWLRGLPGVADVEASAVLDGRAYLLLRTASAEPVPGLENPFAGYPVVYGPPIGIADAMHAPLHE